MHAIHRVKKVMVLLFVLAGCTSVDAGRATAEAYEACKSEFERLYVLHEGRVNPEFDDLPGRIGLRMRIWPPRWAAIQGRAAANRGGPGI